MWIDFPLLSALLLLLLHNTHTLLDMEGKDYENGNIKRVKLLFLSTFQLCWAWWDRLISSFFWFHQNLSLSRTRWNLLRHVISSVTCFSAKIFNSQGTLVKSVKWMSFLLRFAKCLQKKWLIHASLFNFRAEKSQGDEMDEKKIICIKSDSDVRESTKII